MKIGKRYAAVIVHYERDSQSKIADNKYKKDKSWWWLKQVLCLLSKFVWKLKKIIEIVH